MKTPAVPHGVDEWWALPRDYTKVEESLEEGTLWLKLTAISEHLVFLSPNCHIVPT